MAATGIEVELKFSPASEETLQALAARVEFPGWRILERAVENQQNTYYDTKSARLEQGGGSLRRRLLAEHVEWTFKQGPGPGRDGLARRQEVNSRLGVERARDELPSCPAVSRARSLAGGDRLQPTFSLRTLRTEVTLARADGTRLALALDRIALEGDDAAPPYRETEVEIELLRGDERAVVDFGLWLMSQYGLLPLRGSKRGRAMAWRRGVGLPVVAPDLGASLLAERVATISAEVMDRSTIVKLAGPAGSERARALADTLCREWPDATLVEHVEDVAELPVRHAPGIVIVEGHSVLEAGHADAAAWVKAGLSTPLIAHLIAVAQANGMDDWKVLTAFGEYVVPSQRRRLDPAARWADLVVIDEGAPELLALHESRRVKVYAWPSAGALRVAGGRQLDHTVAREQRYLPPPGVRSNPIDVRLVDDVAIVSFTRGDGTIVLGEARPRVAALLTRLGYRLAHAVEISHRRFTAGGWCISLDRVAGWGHWCAIEPEALEPADPAPLLAELGLGGARHTTASYLDLVSGAAQDDSEYA